MEEEKSNKNALSVGLDEKSKTKQEGGDINPGMRVPCKDKGKNNKQHNQKRGNGDKWNLKWLRTKWK